MGQPILNSHKSTKSRSGIAPYGTTTLKVIGKHDPPTLRLFGALEHASYYFQAKLFFQQLSPVILSLNKNTRSNGYYKCNAWLDNRNENLPEININPGMLLDPIRLMQTLVHELSHHYHQIYGKPGCDGYHNKEFAQIMRSIGLECSDTGKPSGRKIGRQMTHYMISNGLFEKAFIEMPEEFIIPFKPLEEL